MSEANQSGPGSKPKSKPGAVRQVVTLIVALGILAAAAVVIYPKFQSRTEGPVRLDIANGSGASMIDPVLSLRVPPGQTVGAMRSVISAGFVVTAYEGMGPVEVESISYTAGADGEPVTVRIDRTLEAGGIMVLRVTSGQVEVDLTEMVPETP